MTFCLFVSARAIAVASYIGHKLIGELDIKVVCKVVVVSLVELMSRWSTFRQLITAINTHVLPAGTRLVNLTNGCVCLTVQAETLSALTALWNLYQDGTLERRLYDFFVTDEVKERAGGEIVEVNVSIEEEEYNKARLELISEAQGKSIL
ncbi:uncharacterized protein LOC110054562 [Orbicella faveolata]|uniref:uncharacterized protein LOC110054562 n=1 Tax=Orbicella faveolata TaxID=48498 RepID=UPI0009E301A0|nr:uncharacterized protein LOC110054562 [Orbicella faveolata]